LANRKPVLDEHLAFLSVKYNVYLTELFEAVVSARKAGQALCQDLKIEYRGSVDGEAIMLITKGGNAIMQVRASEERLLNESIDFKKCMETDQIRKHIQRAEHYAASGALVPIQSLRHGMRKVTVEAEVIEVAAPQKVRTQFGNNVILTNVWVADQTGKIRVCLWNEQAGSIKLGDAVQLSNVSVATFRGERQLRLGSKGTISVLQRVIANVKRELAETPRN